LPNLQARVPVHQGSGFTIGQVGGETNHTLIQSEMAAHNHFVQTDTNTQATSNQSAPAATEVFGLAIGVPSSGSNFPVNPYGAGAVGGALAPQTIGLTGGSQPHVNTQPYLTLNFIVALQGVFPSQN